MLSNRGFINSSLNHLAYNPGSALPYHFGTFDQLCHFRQPIVFILIDALIKAILISELAYQTVLSYSANMSWQRLN